MASMHGQFYARTVSCFSSSSDNMAIIQFDIYVLNVNWRV